MAGRQNLLSPPFLPRSDFQAPQDWPGAYSVNTLLRRAPGGTLVRSREGVRRPRPVRRLRSPRLCHRRDPHARSSALLERAAGRSLSPEDRLASCSNRRKACAEQERKGREPLGRAVILSQDPHSKPIRSKKVPAPGFHAFRQSVRQELSEAYSWLLAAFRTASESCDPEI